MSKLFEVILEELADELVLDAEELEDVELEDEEVSEDELEDVELVVADGQGHLQYNGQGVIRQDLEYPDIV